MTAQKSSARWRRELGLRPAPPRPLCLGGIVYECALCPIQGRRAAPLGERSTPPRPARGLEPRICLPDCCRCQRRGSPHRDRLEWRLRTQAADGPIHSIEGARTGAHAISTGAVAVFHTFGGENAGCNRPRRRRGGSPARSSYVGLAPKAQYSTRKYIYRILRPFSGSHRRLSHRGKALPLSAEGLRVARSILTVDTAL